MTKKDAKGRNLKPGEDQRKNGMYRYRYTDNTGKRQSIYSWRLVRSDKNPSKKHSSPLSLREMIRNIERDQEDHIHTHEAQYTSVYKLLYLYLDTKAMLANSTMLNYIHAIERDIKPNTLANTMVADVKKSDIKRFYAYLYKDKHFAPTTLQLYQNILYPAFQMAVDDNLIRCNPCKDCMKDYVKGGLYSTRYPLTREQQAALLNFIKNDTIYSRHYALIAFMLGTGCRIGEVIGLTWNDIDFEKKTVSINHQAIYRKKVNENKKTHHYMSLPKNEHCRIIPLQSDILQIMLKYKEQTYFMSKANDYEVDGYSTFVFLNRSMKLHLPETLTRTFHGIRDAYNRDKSEEDGDVILPDFTAHTFSHTFCTRMAENGMDVKVLQGIMGHKTIEVTMLVYNHDSVERSKNEVERVASALIV